MTTSTQTEPLPCPFCGHDGELCERDFEHSRYYCQCSASKECQAYGGGYVSWGTKKEAIAAWNTRTQSGGEEQNKGDAGASGDGHMARFDSATPANPSLPSEDKIEALMQNAESMRQTNAVLLKRLEATPAWPEEEVGAQLLAEAFSKEGEDNYVDRDNFYHSFTLDGTFDLFAVYRALKQLMGV